MIRLNIARCRIALTPPILLATMSLLLAGIGSSAMAADKRGAPIPFRETTGAELWVSRYDGGVENDDRAVAVATSTDGAVVFVTGGSTVPPGNTDYRTIAYDAVTGAEIWNTTYDGIAGPGSYDSDEAVAIGVSPDGARVFVTGNIRGEPTRNLDYATVAYDAATGNELWASRYGLKRDDVARGLEVSPDGSSVFVTGRSKSLATGPDYATVAYDAITGDEVWVGRYDGPPSRTDEATAIGAGPDGSALFVTGYSRGASTHRDYATVAYDPLTGGRLWVRRSDGPDGLQDHARALGVSPDGSIVAVTGYSKRSTGVGNTDIVTVALDGATGVRLWSVVYGGSAHAGDIANDVGLSPDGSTVFVGGYSTDRGPYPNYETFAYNAADGSTLWARSYKGPGGGFGFDGINAIVVSPAGTALFVTGQSDGTASGYEYATVAYDTASGSKLWVQRYTGPVSGGPNDIAFDVAVDPDGERVFVTGVSDGFPTYGDYATAAYSAT